MEQRTEIKVRGYHADFYGHVNNARFLEFFEEDRWASLENKVDFAAWSRRGLAFLVVNINVNYRKAVGVGATLVAATGLARVNTKSAVLQQELRFKESGEVAADAEVTFVIIDRSGKAVALEGEMRQELEGLAA